MLVNVLLLLLCVLETLQHLSYPINFCNMASTCLHDSRVVCASSPDGCSRKSFLDQCDMYEYNCDYGTQYMTKVTSSCTSGYQETYILFCGTLTSQIESSTTKNPTSNGISTSSSKQITETLPKNFTSNSHEINPTTIPLTVSTSAKENEGDCCDRPITWETTTQVTHIFEDIKTQYNKSEETQTDETVNEIDKNKQSIETSIEYNITDNLYVTNIHENENYITSTTINQEVSDTENTKTDDSLDRKLTATAYSYVVTQNSPVYCCNRPLTWETTTEVTHIFEHITMENNSEENIIDRTETERDENKQTSKTTTEYNFTNNSYEKTTDIHENINNITFTVTLDDTTLYENNETDEAVNKKLTDKDIVTQTSPVFCCNRPLTWETTTEVTKTFEVVTTENNSDEHKINKTDQDENIDGSIQTTAVVTDTTDSFNIDTTKDFSTSATLTSYKFTKLALFSTRTKCKNECQRPLTWLTTLRRRRYF